MKYKIYYEPMYANECKALLAHIVNGTSIRDEMEESVKECGESMRSSIELLFKKSLALEEYIKKNICLNLPNYEENGHEMAEFLLKKWEHANATPIDAIYSYDLLLSTSVDNKAIMIINTIGLDSMEKIWSVKEIEEGILPPSIDDTQFFGLINNSDLEQGEKLSALKLYYDFASYHAYASALLQHTEELLKSKIHEYATDIKAHMDFIEEDVLTNDTIYLNKDSISINDQLLYHIYPSIYRANSLILNAMGLFPPYIIAGISVFSLAKLYNNAESDQYKATQFLKCLSDNTKQTILQLLKKESLYGSQLAEKLNCSGANVSQHMNTLLNLDVVYIKKENNRVYFYLDKEVIHKHLDTAKEMFG